MFKDVYAKKNILLYSQVPGERGTGPGKKVPSLCSPSGLSGLKTTVEATKMCLKLKNLPKNGRNIHLDTLHGLRKGGSGNSRQLVYSKK